MTRAKTGTVTGVYVEGLAELRRTLRRIDEGLAVELRSELRAAAEIAAADARRRVPVGPGRRGHARNSIKAGTSGASAYIRGGQRTIPYYGWLDFGGAVGRNRSIKRPFLRDGRYLYPAIAATRAEVARHIGSAIDRLIKKAGG